MDVQNRSPLDYYLFPRIDVALSGMKLAEDNGLSLDAYRFEGPDFLYEISAPISIRRAA